jgi:hypothetical protein
VDVGVWVELGRIVVLKRLRQRLGEEVLPVQYSNAGTVQ